EAPVDSVAPPPVANWLDVIRRFQPAVAVGRVSVTLSVGVYVGVWSRPFSVSENVGGLPGAVTASFPVVSGLIAITSQAHAAVVFDGVAVFVPVAPAVAWSTSLCSMLAFVVWRSKRSVMPAGGVKVTLLLSAAA